MLITGIIALILLTFFASAEIAFLSTTRLKATLDKSNGSFSGRALSIFYRNESYFDFFLSFSLSIVFVLFYLSIFLFFDTADWRIITPAIIAVFLLAFIFGSVLPNVLMSRFQAIFFKRFSVPLLIFYFLLLIPAFILFFTGTQVLKLFRLKQEREDSQFSKEDLEEYIHAMNEQLPEEQEFSHEMTILQNALEFTHVKARDCMIPLAEMVSINVDEDIEQLNQLFIEHGLSKIIVYRNSIDNIIGYVHSYEMFKKPLFIKQILLPISFVPAAISGKELLELFTKKSSSIAIVVDEYGGTAGLVTLEDVIEEIIGEIEDEHDHLLETEEQIDQQNFHFSARLHINHLNEKYKFNLPESEDYETLGGLITMQLGSIPEVGAVLEFQNLSLTILEVSDRRVETVLLHLK